MLSQVKTYTYPNGEIQRAQWVKLNNWKELDFLPLSYEEPAFEGFCNIYRRYQVPACPWLFGQMVMFRLPEDVTVEVGKSEKYGYTVDPLTAAAITLEEGVKIRGGKPVFSTDAAKRLYETLEERGCLQIVSGKLPVTTIIAAGNLPGYLTHAAPDARMKINAHFFIMDRFDCATVFDHIGTPIGLCVKNGIVTNPPMYGREALLVDKDGKVTIRPLDIRDLSVEIGGKVHTGKIYTRPSRTHTPNDRLKKLTIVGNKVVAVKEKGRAVIPASGYVLSVSQSDAAPGDSVVYKGLEDVTFGIQIGNSIVRNGVRTEKFLSKFYNIRRFEPVPFPPSLYPMNFDKSRAARTAIGADENGTPILLWAEGKGKCRYTPGKDSCGATLAELADICADAGMVNAVNMDGGGSAQILLRNRRQMLICDRNPDNSEAERAIPMALIVK